MTYVLLAILCGALIIIALELFYCCKRKTKKGKTENKLLFTVIKFELYFNIASKLHCTAEFHLQSLECVRFK